MSSEVGRRIAFTLGALLVFRLGTFIPLPGIDTAVWNRAFGAGAGSILDLADMASGGGARRLAIFALGILPYITAAVLMQLASIGWSRLRALSAAGDRGRDKVVAYTLYLTILFTAFQAYGIALALEGISGLVPRPGILFELSTVLTLTAGTMLLIWLSNLITARGIGNGLALMLAVGFVTSLPPEIAGGLVKFNRGVVSADMIALSLALAAVIVALIAFVEGARRPIEVDYPKQTIGGTTLESRSAQLMLKINSAGLIPTVIASWSIGLALLAVILILGADSPIVHQLAHGRPLFMILFAVLIFLFTLFYTAFVLDPEKASKTLKQHGGTLRGIAAGEPTAAYLDEVVSRVTLIGGVYLALVFVVPELLVSYFGLPFYLGGAPFLLVVCATLDIGAQVRQQAAVNVRGPS